MKIKIKKLRPEAVLPHHGSSAAAGYDVYAAIDNKIVLYPSETVMIPTGLAVAPDEGCWIGVFARSGLAAKEGLRPANCVGVVDNDYRGEIMVALHNDSDGIKYVTPGEKIAQLVAFPTYLWDIEEVEELEDTDRGSGGFGSTGK